MKKVIAWLTMAIVVSVTAAHFSYPAAAAAACPSCYGFLDTGSGIYVERTMSAEMRASVLTQIEAARARVRDFYGNLESAPRILICATDECYRPFGGGSRGIALLDKALFLSPRGIDPVIAAHEIAHTELHRRIGYAATFRRLVPQWFDEGLAVVVSDDPRYLQPNAAPCSQQIDKDLPSSRAAWIETASNADLYARAACRVNHWLTLHDGAAGLLRIIITGSYREITES
jgi:hypothetical protein